MTYFTSDTHFGHKNIIAYCKRPFRDVAEMNAEMIRRWNERVKPGDFVYHLGDFALGGTVETLRAIVAQLNGEITVVLGNHDKEPRLLAVGIRRCLEALAYNFSDHWISLRHLPPEPASERDAPYPYYFHGHVHERYRNLGCVINVGVDQWDFTPRTFEELTAGIPPYVAPWDEVLESAREHERIREARKGGRA